MSLWAIIFASMPPVASSFLPQAACSLTGGALHKHLASGAGGWREGGTLPVAPAHAGLQTGVAGALSAPPQRVLPLPAAPGLRSPVLGVLEVRNQLFLPRPVPGSSKTHDAPEQGWAGGSLTWQDPFFPSHLVHQLRQ